jgi:hypothetical protein
LRDREGRAKLKFAGERAACRAIPLASSPTHLRMFRDNSPFFDPARFLRFRAGMGYVVKITGHSQSPQWIGHNTVIGPKRLVDRDDARVFPTERDAMREIDAFRVLLSDDTQFEFEEERE